MKGAMKIAAIGIAAILSAAIAGCSASGVALDMEAELHGTVVWFQSERGME